MTITIYTIKGVFDGKFFTIFNIFVGFHPSTTIAFYLRTVWSVTVINVTAEGSAYRSILKSTIRYVNNT